MMDFIILSFRACDRCQNEKRKTINGEDIVWAFDTLGFDQYAHLMKIYLQRYKDVMKMDKASGYEGGELHEGAMGYEVADPSQNYSGAGQL